MPTPKEEAIQRILNASDQEAGEVIDFLKAKEKRDPFANCPIDDEPVTPEEAEAIRKAKAEEGGVTLDELKKELGL